MKKIITIKPRIKPIRPYLSPCFLAINPKMIATIAVGQRNRFSIQISTDEIDNSNTEEKGIKVCQKNNNKIGDNNNNKKLIIPRISETLPKVE